MKKNKLAVRSLCAGIKGALYYYNMYMHEAHSIVIYPIYLFILFTWSVCIRVYLWCCFVWFRITIKLFNNKEPEKENQGILRPLLRLWHCRHCKCANRKCFQLRWYMHTAHRSEGEIMVGKIFDNVSISIECDISIFGEDERNFWMLTELLWISSIIWK